MATVDVEQAWTDLHAGLLGFVRRRVRRPEDADDIVQRVFLQLHRSVPQLREADRLPAWIYRTARRAIADHYRSPAGRREVPGGSAADLAEGATLAGAVDGDEDEPSAERELAGCLLPLVTQLAEADRDALRLVEIEEVTQVEAARRLGLSVSGMKSRVQRARTRLRTVVEACCRVELDRRGGLVDYEPRAAACAPCAPSSPALPGTGCGPKG